MKRKYNVLFNILYSLHIVLHVTVLYQQLKIQSNDPGKLFFTLEVEYL